MYIHTAKHLISVGGRKEYRAQVTPWEVDQFLERA